MSDELEERFRKEKWALIKRESIKTAITILICTAIVFTVWVLARSVAP